MKKYMQKFISLITAICFILLSFDGVIFAQYPGVVNYTNGITQNLLSQNLGSVTYSNLKDSQNVVINIQDLHGNSQVQKNIYAILKYLSENNDIKAIYLEGASDKVDVSWLKKLDEKDKTEISETLLNMGMLTGTEYFALNDTKNIPLFGLENKKVHQDNINRLATIINNSDLIEEKLSSIKKDLNILNAKYVNSRNKTFSNLINTYRIKKIDTLHFYSELLNYVEKISKNPEDYNNVIFLQKEDFIDLSLFKDMLQLEAKIDRHKLSNEIQDILVTIKENSSATEYTNLINSTNNLSDLTTLIDNINRFCSNKNIDLTKKYPNIDLTIQYQNKAKDINLSNVLKQEHLIINNIKTALSYNSTEYEIIFLNDFYAYLEKALTNNLTAKDYDYFIKSINKFETLYPKYVVYNQLKDIKEYIDISKLFYKTNNERNNIFLENIKNTISKNNEDKNVIVAVTGGYHSEGVNKLLSASNISFVSVTPNLPNIKNNSNVYNSIIKEESSLYSKATLAFTIASQMSNTTFIKTLITTALHNKVPFNQIKQICENIFKENFVDNGTDFTITINNEPVTIEQKNGYAIFTSDTSIVDESLYKDLSLLTQDMTSTDTNLGIKLLLNLLNVLNRSQSFDIFSLTRENEILQSIIKTLVFMVEDLNIQFSNGFERIDIEEYVNSEIMNNPARQDNTLDGVDINTARFLPAIVQSILYENDRTEANIDTRIQQAYTRVDTSYETDYLKENYKFSLQISGLLASIIKEVLAFAETDKISPEIKTFLNGFTNISDLASYIAVTVFHLADDVKGISLAQGLIGLTTSIQYPMLIECLGHEFGHEALLLAKSLSKPGTNELVVHETHSFLFSLLFAQIFNEMLKTSLSDDQERDYDKFSIDLTTLYTKTVRRNLTDETQSMDERNEVHVSALNFINMLNRCLGKDGKIMNMEQLITLTETVREVFLIDEFKDFPYSVIFYTILMEFAKKLNPSSEQTLNKYYTQIADLTKFFTLNEMDGDSFLIENFANIMLTGTTQEIESFINNKFLTPQVDKQEYKRFIRNIYVNRLKIYPELYDIIDEIFFTVFDRRILALKNRILSTETKKFIAVIMQELQAFIEYCELSNINKRTAFENLLKALKAQNDIESLSDNEISKIFMDTFDSTYKSSLGRFNISQTDSDMYETINKVLPEILQRHNKDAELTPVIDLILHPSTYQSIDITKEILKADSNLEDILEILTELFVTLVRDSDFSFNTDITNPTIKEYAKGRQTIADLPVELFSKLPSFIQEILYNAETINITKDQNEFTQEYFIQNKNKTNALLKLILQETYSLLQNEGYDELLSIPNTDNLTIFAGFIPSGVSNGNFIAINPKDESFLNVIAHELGHILFTSAKFSQYKSVIVHELFAYSLGLLATTIYNDADIETQEMLPVTYENIVDSDEHSLPKTLLQLIIYSKGRPLNGREILSVLRACKAVMQEDISRIDNITLAYKILDILEQDSYLMRDLLPNSLTMKLEIVLDEPEERKNRILQQLFNVEEPGGILIVDKESFIRNPESNIIFIDRKILNDVFDDKGDLIKGKEQEFSYLVELVQLQTYQEYDLTKQEIASDFERLYQGLLDLGNMLKYGSFSKFVITFKRNENRTLLQDGRELIYINHEYLKKIGPSKYSEYLTNAVILRSLERKLNNEFSAKAKFDFYVGINNLDEIEIDFQKFTNAAKPLEYLKQVYNEYSLKQEKIDTAIDKVLSINHVKDKELFKNKIKDLMFLVDNPNIEFTSIEFFRILGSGINHSTMQEIYENLIDVYSYLIKNNLFAFNSSLDQEIENYITSAKIDNLDGVEIVIANKMPIFIQKLLYENMRAEENFKQKSEFAKEISYKRDPLNGLLNILAHDIANIVASVYPQLNTEILSTQLFFATLRRLSDGANYSNHNIAISNQLVNRYKSDPEILAIEILKTISHELGHEELFLKDVTGDTNLINTLHEFYAYLFEALFIKAYSKKKGISETESVYTRILKQSFIDDIVDLIAKIANDISYWIVGKKDEHYQALWLIDLLQEDRFKDLFTEEKIIETLDIIDRFATGINIEEDGITKTLRVDDLNMQSVSFLILMFMFGNEIDNFYPNLLTISKSLTLFNTEQFDQEKVLIAFARKDFEYINGLINTIIVKGNARTKEINDILFGDKTVELNGTSYGFSITTNRSENGLLKDGKMLIYFTPTEIKFLVDNLGTRQENRIKLKANDLVSKISEEPIIYLLPQQVSLVTKDELPIKKADRLLNGPIERLEKTLNFVTNLSKTIKEMFTPSPFKDLKSVSVVYYDDYGLIEPNQNILSVYITSQEQRATSFDLTEYTINGRTLRVAYDIKKNILVAYCPKAGKQEIIEMTAKYIKTGILPSENKINLKNIVIDSEITPDTINYHLSEDNEGFEYVSTTFMDQGMSFIEDLLKIDDVESVMFAKQIYDYVGNISFRQLSNILKDKSLAGSQVIIDSTIFSSIEMIANGVLLKTLLKNTQLKLVVKVTSQNEIEKIYNGYGISNFMLETEKDNLVQREIVEYEPSQGVIQKAPVSYIELTDLTNLEERLEQIPSHQTIVISVNADAAKNINISDNMILSSLKTTLTRILKTKTISTKTAGNMGKEFAKQINISEEEKGKLADYYNSNKHSLTIDTAIALAKDYPNVFNSQVQSYIEKLLDSESKDITPAAVAFIDAFLNDILYEDFTDRIEVSIQVEDMKRYRSLLSAA